jgi:hypothetical protein
MTIERAMEINRRLVMVMMAELGLADEAVDWGVIRMISLKEMIEATEMVEAQNAAAREKPRAPGEGCEQHCVCDMRAIAAIYVMANYFEGPVLRVGGLVLGIVPAKKGAM